MRKLDRDVQAGRNRLGMTQYKGCIGRIVHAGNGALKSLYTEKLLIGVNIQTNAFLAHLGLASGERRFNRRGLRLHLLDPSKSIAIPRILHSDSDHSAY